jgi:hypothetical protein
VKPRNPVKLFLIKTPTITIPTEPMGQVDFTKGRLAVNVDENKPCSTCINGGFA